MRSRASFARVACGSRTPATPRPPMKSTTVVMQDQEQEPVVPEPVENVARDEE